MSSKVKVDVFKSAMRRIGAQSEGRLEEVVKYLDPLDTGTFAPSLSLSLGKRTRNMKQRDIFAITQVW